MTEKGEKEMEKVLLIQPRRETRLLLFVGFRLMFSDFLCFL